MNDAEAYTTVGHSGMAICNPVGSGQLDEVVALVAPAPGEACRAIDIGCGKGEFLIRIAESYGGSGLGVDPNPEFVALARAAAEQRAPGLVEFRETKADTVEVPSGAYNVAAVIGATHAYGGTAATLAALAAATRPGGHVVLGDGFWRREPTADELKIMDIERGELTSLHALLGEVESASLDPLHVVLAREDDWDRYEWAHLRNIYAHLQRHPSDPQAGRLWARRKAWRDAYLQAGRALMGFALIVARRS